MKSNIIQTQTHCCRNLFKGFYDLNDVADREASKKNIIVTSQDEMRVKEEDVKSAF